MRKNPDIHDYYDFVMESPPKPETVINGKKYLYFGGVGYYQLHSHPEVIEAAVEATRKFGINSSTSRSITGMTQLHFDVERKAAEFFDTDDAAYLPSGYLSNIAGIQALDEMGKFDVVFVDETAHYCNRDGAFSVNKPVFIFKSNDPDDLDFQLQKKLQPGLRPLIITDGLFSVFGVIAKIPEFLELAEKHDGIIWIDDAHASGVIGPNGRGCYEYHQLKSNRLYMGSTLSKAFGGFGGIIPGEKEFVGFVRKGNVLKGGTHPMFAAAAASLKGLELVMKHPEMREILWANARYLKRGLISAGIEVEENDFPMTAFSAGTAGEMKNLHQTLLNKGIFIQYSDYVGAGKEGVLRMVVFSTHTREQIKFLIDTLKSHI